MTPKRDVLAQQEEAHAAFYPFHYPAMACGSTFNTKNVLNFIQSPLLIHQYLFFLELFLILSLSLLLFHPLRFPLSWVQWDRCSRVLKKLKDHINLLLFLLARHERQKLKNILRLYALEKQVKKIKIDQKLIFVRLKLLQRPRMNFRTGSFNLKNTSKTKSGLLCFRKLGIWNTIFLLFLVKLLNLNHQHQLAIHLLVHRLGSHLEL